MQKYLLKQQFEGFSVSASEGLHKCAPQLDYDDLEQINDDDIEEMDLKWHVAMISMRIKKFHKRTGRKLQFDTKDLVGFDKTKIECFNCHKIGHFARDCKAKGNQDSRRRDSGYNENKARDNDTQNYAMMAYSSSISGSNNEVQSCSKTCAESYARLKKLYDGQRDKLGDASVEITAYTLALKKNVFMNKECDLEDTPVNDRYAKGMHAVPPPMTGNYMPSESDVEINYSKFTYGPKQTSADESDSKPVEYASSESDPSVETTTSMHAPVDNAPKIVCEPKVWTDAPIIKEYESDNDDESVSNVQENIETPSFAFIDSVKHDDPHKVLKDKGLVDSECSRHMTGTKAHLADYEEFKGGFVAFGGSNGRINGKVKIKANRLDFEDVYYVEELKHYNLFSVSQMCDKKNKVLFTDTDCLVLSLNFKLPDENQVLLKIPRQHNMYSFNLKNIDPSRDLSCLFTKASIDESNKWHKRLGHVNFKNLNKLVKGNLVRGLPSKIFKNDHTCVACQKGKQHKASCKAKTVSSVNQPLQILHMNLFGPTSVRSINHKTYFLVITDGFSRFSWVCFLKSKDETTPILMDFIRQAKNQFNHKVKTIRSDNGTKFKIHDLIEFCRLQGIKREYSNARTPQQNGVAERKNMTLIESARTMVLLTKPPNKTPYELLTGRQPIISYLRPIRCHVTILNTIDQLGKFDRKSDSGFLVGYSLNSKAFRVYNLETNRVEENLHVNFLENKPNVAGKGHAWMFDHDYLKNSMNYEPISLENQANKSAGPKEVNHSAGKEANDDQGANSKEIDLHDENFILTIWSAYSTTVKSSRTNTEKTSDVKTSKKPTSQVEQIFHTPISAIGPIIALNDDEPSYPDDPSMPHLEDIYASPSERIFNDSSYDDEGVITDFNNLDTTVNVSPTPTIRIHIIHPKTQILGDPMSAVQTRSKVNKNFEAHALVWILVDLPFGKKAIGTKWVYRNKKDEKGVVVRNKARLVAQGHRQEEGIDYDEVFAPVARIEAIKIFLAFASYMGFIVYQMDVNSVFLYGTIDEEVYVTQPPSFVDPKFPNKVYKVVKALYGLHQAPRAWYATLSTFLEESGYKRGAIDKTLFIKQDKKDIMLCEDCCTPIEIQKPFVKDEEAADIDISGHSQDISPLSSEEDL
nr:hypothetical protein [Tanacetum cinerariifolium]